MSKKFEKDEKNIQCFLITIRGPGAAAEHFGEEDLYLNHIVDVAIL
jgi:hypothetical protein